MKTFLIAGSLALTSTSALAQPAEGFYVNASFGQAKYDVSQNELDAVALAAFDANNLVVLGAVSNLDEKDTAWSIAGGYRFSPYFAVELGYLDLGSATYRANGPVLFPGVGVVDGAIGIDIAAKGPTLSVIALVPIGEQFDVHGNLGVFFSKTTLDVSVALDDVSGSQGISSRTQDVFAGVGAAFHFSENVAVSLDYSFFKKVGDEAETGEVDVDSLQLGVQYKF